MCMNLCSNIFLDIKFFVCVWKWFFSRIDREEIRNEDFADEVDRYNRDDLEDIAIKL